MWVHFSDYAVVLYKRRPAQKVPFLCWQYIKGNLNNCNGDRFQTESEPSNTTMNKRYGDFY